MSTGLQVLFQLHLMRASAGVALGGPLAYLADGAITDDNTLYRLHYRCGLRKRI
jgi:hypothetical protein